MDEIRVLNPGQFHFGNSGRLKTLLGSCVAITIWHPNKKAGGMCHFLLPTNSQRRNKEPDGRYADQALELFMGQLAKNRTQPGEYEVKLFGGGNMFPSIATAKGDVGKRNIQAAKDLLHERGFRIKAQHVGEAGHRSVIFDLESGQTWVKWQPDHSNAETPGA